MMKTRMSAGATKARVARWGKVSAGVAAVVCAVAIASPAMADAGDGYGYDFGSGNSYSYNDGSGMGYGNGYGQYYGDGYGQPSGSANWWAGGNVVQNILQGQSWGGPTVQNSGLSPQQYSSFGNSISQLFWR